MQGQVLHEHSISFSPDFAYKFAQATRGAWLGLNRGIYKRGNLAMGQDCLNDIAIDNFVDAIHIFRGDDEATGDIFTGIGKLTYVLANMNTCNFRQPVLDLIEWCDNTDPETTVTPTIN